MPPIDLSRLKSQLLTSGLQQKDNPLYQVINQLIGLVEKFQENTLAIISPSGSNVSLTNLSFITDGNEAGSLPNSRRLLAGAGIAFDDSVANERTISASLATATEFYAPLTDGDEFETLLIFANGECVMAVEHA